MVRLVGVEASRWVLGCGGLPELGLKHDSN